MTSELLLKDLKRDMTAQRSDHWTEVIIFFIVQNQQILCCTEPAK